MTVEEVVAAAVVSSSMVGVASSVNQKNVLLKLISVEKFLLDLA